MKNEKIKEYKKLLKETKFKRKSKEELERIFKEIEKESKKVTQIPDHIMRTEYIRDKYK